MCGIGGAQQKQAQQQAQIASWQQQVQQDQQMAMQRQMQQQMAEQQQANYQEQLAISKAPPPPAPNETAMAATPALETVDQATAQAKRAGSGRKKLRTDMPQVSTLAIPGVA
jgi:hypothetical protein